MSLTTLPLSKLRASPLNVRQTKAGDDVDDLVASIAAHGMLSHLIVHKLTSPRGTYGVLAGGRRLRALQQLQADGRLDADHPVDVEIRNEDAGTSTEISVIENTARVALPPVEEFLAFAKLAEDGADTAAIAERFGTTEIRVRQRMRLGQLHPAILEALERREITLDAAKAYASNSDQTMQKRVFDRQSAVHHHADHAIRAHYRAQSAEGGVDEMLLLVGLDAYTAAGGRAEEDLFLASMPPRILDLDVLRSLFEAKMIAETEALDLPDRVTLQLRPQGLGAYVEVQAEPTDEQMEQLRAIDVRCDAIQDRLDEIAEWDQDGAADRIVAIAGQSQDEVNNLVAEQKRLEIESERINDGSLGLPDGPLIAVGVIHDGRIVIDRFHRPADWSPDVQAVPAPIGGTRAARTVPAPSPQTQRVADAFDPNRRYAFNQVQPESVAKTEHGLSKDAVEAARSMRRQALAGLLLEDVSTQRIAADYLIFVLARGMLAKTKEPAGRLGVDSLPRHEYDPAVARDHLAGQPGAVDARRNLVDGLQQLDWMTASDLPTALRLFVDAPQIEKTEVAAHVAVAMLSRSMNAPGFTVDVHDALVGLLQIDDPERIRAQWTPDERFFSSLPKARRLDAIRAIDPDIAKAVSTLGNAELSAEAARIMAAEPPTASKYGMTTATIWRARAWLPDYMTFRDPIMLDRPIGDGRGASLARIGELQAEAA